MKGKEMLYYYPVQSLQDVFSESGNSSGFCQKTSCPPAGEAGLFIFAQGIWRNLNGMKTQNQSEDHHRIRKSFSKSETNYKAPIRNKE
ncbi:MAG: hypothetical protein HC819_21780 [Cyclobacteriaceae bacterium]|nr:hypothetical protein [Cyclobacteriaceae bacterium]